MIIYNNSPEVRGQSNIQVYIKCMIAALALVIILVLSGYGVKYMVILLIKYWYILGFSILFLLVIKYVFQRKRRMQQYAPQYPPQYYNQ